MEREVALKEWCYDSALRTVGQWVSDDMAVEEVVDVVIKASVEIEKYITNERES